MSRSTEKLGGLLFVAAGILPWIGAIISSNVSLVAFFWTPLLVFAGILAISDRPGTYVDEEMDDNSLKKVLPLINRDLSNGSYYSSKTRLVRSRRPNNHLTSCWGREKAPPRENSSQK
jgi:hypothetical protein